MTDREELKAKNLETFADYYPNLHERLVDYEAKSELVVDDDGSVDTLFAGEYFYGRDSKTYVERQMTVFWRNPTRVKLHPPQSGTMDEHSGRFLFRTLREASELGRSFQQDPGGEEAFFMVIFGIGLGTHIEELIERSNCRTLVLIEPNLEFLFHSLEIHDWTKTLETMADRGGRTHIIVESSPESIAMQIRSVIRIVNPCSLDGTMIFTHYAHPTFLRAQHLFSKELLVVLSGLGFFYDETIMIRNAHANLFGGQSRVYMRPDDPFLDIPVFVVASGPSVDKDLDVISENADRAIIVSCGSAIRPLMVNGIKPDFQIENENIEVHPIISQVAENYDLSGVHLVTASTVDQTIIKYFDSVLYFFRSALSPFPIFCDTESRCIRYPSPTVANAGLSFAQEMGFREIYMFGMDCGTRDKDRHHSKDSYHYTPYRQALLDAGKISDPEFEMPVPANFGGVSYTNQDLYSTLDTLKNAVLHWSRGRTYFNCSDGAMIELTLPKPSRLIKVDDIGDRKREVVEKLVADNFPNYSTEEFERNWQDETIADSISAYIGEVTDVFEKFDDFDDKRYLMDLNEVLSPEDAKYTQAMALLFRGTIWQMLIAYEFYATRLEQEDQAGTFQGIARRELYDVLEFLKERATDRLGALSEKTAAGIEISATD